jgi:hypothetical protein
MSRRIEIELTSTRPDGSWTWRAAGAREPKGVLAAALLPSGGKVGDVLRAEAEFLLDGIDIVEVLAPKGARREPERIEVIGSGSGFEPVTQTLAPRTDRPRRDRPDRGDRPRGDRPRGDRPPGDRPRGDRPPGDRAPRRDGRPGEARGDRPPRAERPPRPDGDGARAERPRRDRPPRPPVPELPQRPKPKRLRPGRHHRQELLASLPDEHQPIAEQLVRGGIPAVREALQEQNTRLKAEGKPEVKAGGVLALAEDLLPRVRVAEWLDEATAAQATLDELDLRDLRAVVTRSDDPAVARDERTRELATQLREGLAVRQDKEHQEWLADIDAALGVGRAVRALRLSSRPPKAGVRFPADLGARLSQAASASLTAETTGERWVAVIEAVAYSPVHATVTALSVPTVVPDEVKVAATRLASLVPEIAKQLGIQPPPPGTRAPRPPRPQTRRPSPPKPPPARPAPPAPTPASETAVTDAPTAEAAVTEALVVEAAATETDVADAAAATAEVTVTVADDERPAVEAPVEPGDETPITEADALDDPAS